MPSSGDAWPDRVQRVWHALPGEPSAGPQGLNREVTWKDEPRGLSEWGLVISKVIDLAVSNGRHVYI